MKEKIISKALIVLTVFFLPIFITTIFTDFGNLNTQYVDQMVKVHYTEGEMEIPLEAYLIGVVAAEIPISFEDEALKAQAIAARTYTLKRLQDHPELVFTKDIQSYYSENELEALWGIQNYALQYSKIKTAVVQTRDYVLLYSGQLIDAVFHSTSIGMTRSAEEVWGQDIPYLQQVESLEDINAPTYLHKYELSYEEFESMALAFDAETIFTQDLSNEIQISERNNAGYILAIQVGNKQYTGEVFRKIFGLASSNFSIVFREQIIEIVCKGYGHGVGLSQYGAEAMAKAGANYKDILLHYYKDVSLSKYKTE